jgi:hypothetical protein
MPDVVGNVKYAGTWGTAQISGAIHEVTDIGTRARRRDEDIGFAVAGYLGVNLPMIAAGDAAWLAVTYTEGAVAYVSGGQNQGSGPINLNGLDGNAPLFNAQFGGIPLTDGAINNRGRLELTEAFSVAGGLRHYWVPNNLRSNLFGSWLMVENGNGTNFARRNAGAFNGTRFGLVDFEEFRVGGNLIWSPIGPGFDIGVEVIYKNLQFDNGGIVVQRANVAGPAGSGRLRRTDEEDAFEGRVRVQRDF